MAVSIILNCLLSNNRLATSLNDKTETLKIAASALDGIICVVLATLAIASSIGAFGGAISPGITGVIAGACFGIGFMIIKDVLNLIIRKISKKNFWGTEKTERYLLFTNMILGSIATIVFTSLYVNSMTVISRARCIPSFYSGFGASSGGVVLGSFLISVLATSLISSMCNRSGNNNP